MKTGIELITDERQRQIESHEFTLEGDLAFNTDFQLSKAACYYAWLDPEAAVYMFPPDWDKSYMNRDPKDPVKNLVRAGALIAAEIDRIRGSQTGE